MLHFLRNSLPFTPFYSVFLLISHQSMRFSKQVWYHSLSWSLGFLLQETASKVMLSLSSRSQSNSFSYFLPTLVHWPLFCIDRCFTYRCFEHRCFDGRCFACTPMVSINPVSAFVLFQKLNADHRSRSRYVIVIKRERESSKLFSSDSSPFFLQSATDPGQWYLSTGADDHDYSAKKFGTRALLMIY